jgi:hypothetical protein
MEVQHLVSRVIDMVNVHCRYLHAMASSPYPTLPCCHVTPSSYLNSESDISEYDVSYSVDQRQRSDIE